MKEVALEKAQRVSTLASTQTDALPRQVEMLRKPRDIKAADLEIAQRVGSELWNELKQAAQALMSHVDLRSNDLRIPPEGIHPEFALAAAPLMRAREGFSVSAQELADSDAALAGAISSSNSVAAATVELFLRQFGVERKQAPRTFAALDQTLPTLPPDLSAVIEELQGALKSRKADTASADGRLTQMLKKLPPENLLRVQRRLGEVGLMEHRNTFHGMRPTPAFEKAFPHAVAFLRETDVREVVLRAELANDATYQGLFARKEQLENRAVKAAMSSPFQNDLKMQVGEVEPAARERVERDLLDWGIHQDLKLRFLEAEAKASSNSKEVGARTIEEVFFSHLSARRENDLEKDLRVNYHPDLIFTQNHGNFFGHEGVRRSAALLERKVHGRKWTMDRLAFTPGKTPNEGYATETWSAQIRGKLVTAIDNFYIKDGKILMQSAYYLDPDPVRQR